MSNNNPSVDPANLDTLKGAFRHIVNKILQTTDGVLPARVVAYDGKYVQVQPLISVVGTDGTPVSRGQIAKLPVVKIGGGGFIFNIPLQPGDLGIIIACDRDISLFLQSNNESSPNTYRVKNFADSFFIPTVLTGYSISETDASNAVIQSLNGDVKISIANNKITAKAPEIDVDCSQINFTGSASQITINSPVQIVMNTPLLGVNGDIIATGDITPHGVIPTP